MIEILEDYARLVILLNNNSCINVRVITKPNSHNFSFLSYFNRQRIYAFRRVL
jgi:hypothetical protein